MIKNIERTRVGVDALIDRAHDTVIDVAGHAEDGVRSTAERMVERTHLTGKRVRDEVDTVSRDAHRKVKRAARAVDHGVSRVRGDISRATTTASDYVHGHPGKSLLIAASAGFVIGLLIHRPA